MGDSRGRILQKPARRSGIALHIATDHGPDRHSDLVPEHACGPLIMAPMPSSVENSTECCVARPQWPRGRWGAFLPSPWGRLPAPFLIWGTLASTHHSPREREQLPTQSASRALYTYTYTDTYHCRVSTRSYRVLRFVNAYFHYSFTGGGPDS